MVYRNGLLADSRMRYKLICIDMDGTLLDDKGIMIATVTGRGGYVS